MEFTNEDYIKKIINDMKKIGYIKPEEIPNIDLYMDQVTTFMDEHLRAMRRYDDDKILTKTMINNYSKNDLLPSPNKKKYSKDHMLLLIFIYYFKNVLSISDIQSILEPLTEKFFGDQNSISLEDVYREVFSFEHEQMESITKDVIRKQFRANHSFEAVEDEEAKAFLKTFSMISMLSFDVYVKKSIIEHIIDEEVAGIHAAKKSKKEEKKEKKKDE